MAGLVIKENVIHAPIASGVAPLIVVGTALGLVNNEAVLARATAPIVPTIGLAIVKGVYGSDVPAGQRERSVIDLVREGRIDGLTQADGSAIVSGQGHYLDPANPGKFVAAIPSVSGQLRQTIVMGGKGGEVLIAVGSPNIVP